MLNRDPFAEERAAEAGASRMNRRDFLAGAAAVPAALGLGACASPETSMGNPPRIVVVGGGMAGLNAAYQLQKRGVAAEVYEASNRSGGRMFTATGLMGEGLTTELGGEFIDSVHGDLLDLADEFGLELLDTHAPAVRAFRETFFFDGRHYGEADAVEAFRPLAARIAADFDSLGDTVDFRNEGGAGALDRTSLGEYLGRIGADGWIRALLDVAYVTEYGLDAGEQSALNLIFLISPDVTDGFEIFGESDERFKTAGGNQRIADETARRLKRPVRLEHRLEAVAARGAGFRLTFEGPNGSAMDADADIVVLAIPFSVLREVDLRLDLPPTKRKAIRELGYGTNAKVFAGVDRRVWRDSGFSGEAFSDERFQLAWDNSLMQPGAAGGITFYSGGRPGLAAGEGGALEQVERLLPGYDKAFPGSAAQFNRKAARMHWPTHPFALGSYACYKPGQWTSISGAEGLPVGNLYFAGEHTSTEFQGYMNGAAQSGRLAAEALLANMARAG